MPEQRVVIETYWCPGPWPWQWLDTCTREVTRWCYDFSYIHISKRYAYTNYNGCEHNRRYSWRSYNFPLSQGDATEYFVTKCYATLRPENGPCYPTQAELYFFVALERLIEDKVNEILKRGSDKEQIR